MLTPLDLFDLLSDETRLRCLVLILQHKELCVCELCAVIGGLQPKISRHLAIMRKSGLILDERRGSWVYYRLHPGVPVWAKQILSQSLNELRELDPHVSDLKKSREMRKHGLCV